MIKSSKGCHFWVRARILIPPGGLDEPRGVLKMRGVVPQTSFLASVHFLWQSLFVWFGNRTGKFGYYNPNFENRRDPKLDQRKDGGIIFGGCFMVGNCLSEMGLFWRKTNTFPCPLFLPPTNGWMDGWTDGHRKLKTWRKSSCEFGVPSPQINSSTSTPRCQGGWQQWSPLRVGLLNTNIRESISREKCCLLSVSIKWATDLQSCVFYVPSGTIDAPIRLLGLVLKNLRKTI